MKLLHVIAGMDPRQGGVCQAVRTMIAGLAEQGVESEVASLDAPGTSRSPTDTFPLHDLGPSYGPWNYGAELGPWLLRNMARFDAIILHGLWLYQGYAVHKALRRYKAQRSGNNATGPFPKLFVMPHGMLDPYFQRAANRRLKAWRNWAYWQLVEGAIVNQADGVLFTCETERRLAHESFAPYRPQREIVMGLGVEEPPPYTPAMREAFLAKCPELRNRAYLLFLSRIHEKKGVDLLLHAYKAVVGKSEQAVCQVVGQTGKAGCANTQLPALVVAGPGLETPYGYAMQQVVATCAALQDAVVFPDMLEGDAKWGAFYGCEAFVLPSHQENFGIAVVEALACGKPVLVSNQVNIWQEIADADAGLVADDTLAGVQTLLERWIHSSTERKQALSQYARKAYQQHFAIAPMAKKISKELAQILK